MEDLTEVQEALGLSFRDPSLLRQALIHGSFANENPTLTPVPNERLEFLGDAVLGTVVATRLYLDMPDVNEGELTKRRALLIRGNTLARVAEGIGLGRYLYLGKGEESSGGRHKPANLAAVLEAVIGAFYLDQGLDAAADFILRLLQPEMEESTGQPITEDYKSELQEFFQARRQQTPTYHLVEAIGPDHDKRFTVEVRLDDTVLGQGSGKSKKLAETDAAHSILKRVQPDFTR